MDTNFTSKIPAIYQFHLVFRLDSASMEEGYAALLPSGLIRFWLCIEGIYALEIPIETDDHHGDVILTVSDKPFENATKLLWDGSAYFYNQKLPQAFRLTTYAVREWMIEHFGEQDIYVRIQKYEASNPVHRTIAGSPDTEKVLEPRS